MQRTGEFASPYRALAAQAAARPDAIFLRAPASAELPYAPDGFSYSYGEALARIEALRAGVCGGGLWPWRLRGAAPGKPAGVLLALARAERARRLDHADQSGAARRRSRLSARNRRARSRGRASGDACADRKGERDDAHRRAGRGAAALPRGRDAPDGERDDPCALLFTSGTTAKPKCCVLSNDYFLRSPAGTSRRAARPRWATAETVLTPLPMFHMNALGCTVVGMILTGGAVVPLDRFHARRWWRTVKDSGATVIHYLGVMPAILLQLDAGGRRHDAQRALRLRRRRRSAPSGEFRAALRLSADRGLGDDRDRRGRRHLHGRRAAPCRAALHRPRRRRTWTIASSMTKAPTSRAARRASCWCGGRAATRGAASSPNT